MTTLRARLILLTVTALVLIAAAGGAIHWGALRMIVPPSES